MTIEMKKVWFDGEKMVTQNILESDIYKRHWDIASCKAYAEQLRDKNRANTAEHAAEAIEYLLALAQPEQEPEPVAVKHMKEWVEYLKRKSDHGQHMKIPSEMSAGACWELAIELEQFINTHPPQRKPLTHDELSDIWFKQSTDWMEFARAIEAAHGIKENT